MRFSALTHLNACIITAITICIAISNSSVAQSRTTSALWKDDDAALLVHERIRVHNGTGIQGAYLHPLYYSFKGDQYMAYRTGIGVLPGYPKSISQHWKGWPNDWDYVDAAYYDPETTEFYFFRGTDYLVYRSDIGVLPSFPDTIKRRWSNWPDHWTHIDAATRWEDATVYLFRGKDYLSFENAGRVVGPVRSVQENWRDWYPEWTSVNSAVRGPQDSFAYFFRGTEYISYDSINGVRSYEAATTKDHYAMVCADSPKYCQTRMDKISFAGTHNSGAGYRGLLRKWGTGVNQRYVASGLFRNQELSFTDQLDGGIRYFDIDTIWVKDHPSGDDPWWEPDGAWIVHNGEFAGERRACAGPVQDLIDQVDAWMSKTENRHEVVFIHFNGNIAIDETSDKKRIAEDIVDMVRETWPDKTTVRQEVTNPTTNVVTAHWPKMGDAIRQDTRIVILMSSKLTGALPMSPLIRTSSLGRKPTTRTQKTAKFPFETPIAATRRFIALATTSRRSL